jgi:O-antigen ligase
MTLVSEFVASLKSRRIADYLAIAVGISFPWSTSATSILLTLWLLAYFPTFKFADLRKELLTPAGGFPILLFVWAAVGMSWADTSWRESLDGLRQFDKLLFIPVALAYFRRSNFGVPAVCAFIVSCVVLLALSFVTALWPGLQWWQSWGPGVPVKNYVTQSAEFAVSAFCILYVAIDAWKAGALRFSIIAFIVAFAFIVFMVFVVTSRTELVVIAALVVAFSARLYGLKGLLGGVVTLCIISAIAWTTSSYLRTRIAQTESDMKAFRSDTSITSTEYRLEFWKKSIRFIYTAPLFGHGTGSIRPLFEQSAVGNTGIAAVLTSKPHNQILAVAIQLGVAGTIILCGMWLAHLLVFTEPGVTAWLGMVVVIQNFAGSLFNTHLFDFTEGWIYVCCVGALGGACLRDSDSSDAQRRSSLRHFEQVLPKWLAQCLKLRGRSH